MNARLVVSVLLAAAMLTACTQGGRYGLFGNPAEEEREAAQPAIVPSYEPSSPEYFTNLIGDRVWFLVDQSNITDDARSVLALQAEWLNTNAQYSITIEGHADEQGTREYNLALGARRASAVKDYLVGLGVASGRITTVTYGKERPVAACSNESCWSQNRRAVTLVNTELTG